MNSSLLRCCKERGRYMHVSKKLVTVKEVIGGITFKRVVVDTRTRGNTYRAPRDENGVPIKFSGRRARHVPPYIGMTGKHHPHQGARECARRLSHA